MGEDSLWALVSRTVKESGSIEKAVFFLLFAFSLVSWCIIFLKIYDLYTARQNSAKFLKLFDSADSFGTVISAEHTLGASPMIAIFKAAMEALQHKSGRIRSVVAADPRQIALKPLGSDQMTLVAMQHAAGAEFNKLQKGLGFLATIGSTSPFIGLFGTVWGIMNTFRVLKDSASLAVVAPGISSALIATAAGLAVAIPAVMAYNLFLAQIDSLQQIADGFTGRVMVLIKDSGFLNDSADAAHRPVSNAQPAAGALA